jgi:hypothetical protein
VAFKKLHEFTLTKFSCFIYLLPLTPTEVSELSAINTLHDMMPFKRKMAKRESGDLPYGIDVLLYEISTIYRQTFLYFQ